MDIVCPRCAEPCDMDELHGNTNTYGVEVSYDEARRIFFDPSRGCGVLFNDYPCEDNRTDARAQASSVMADLLGDDIDGIASLMDDATYLGMFD